MFHESHTHSANNTMLQPMLYLGLGVKSTYAFFY